MAGRGQQAGLLECLTPVRRGEQDRIAGRLVGAGAGGDLLQAVQRFLRSAGITLSQQVTQAGGNDIRIIGIDKLEAIQRLADQILTLHRFTQAHLLQQQLLLRRVGGLSHRHERQAKR